MSRAAAILVGVAVGVTSCGSGSGVTVEMLDNRFEPSEITVPEGTQVTFLGAGRNPHNAVASDGSWSTEEGFGSLEQFEGDAATRTFETPGTYGFFCTFHGDAQGRGMAGVLTVVAGEGTG